MGVIKQPSDRISEWTRRNPIRKKHQTGGRIAERNESGTKILPVQLSSKQQISPKFFLIRKTFRRRRMDRSLQKFCRKEDSPGEQQRTIGASRDKSGRKQANFSQRIAPIAEEICELPTEAGQAPLPGSAEMGNYGTGFIGERLREEKPPDEKKSGRKRGGRGKRN
ncbi:hypothetical protein niasHT_032597 [Heterodera trifolii]|uniref:Uncharacterized protein n=1 Tax=Heterodera trifolii TaxID=157864 RepID=A0ABD2IEM2_9BILA